MKRALLLVVLALGSSCGGCGACSKKSEPAGAAVEAAPPPAAPPTRPRLQISEAGQVVHVLVPTDEGWRLEDQAGGQVGAVRLHKGKVEVVDQAGARRALAEGLPNGFIVVDSAGKQALKVEGRGGGWALSRDGAPLGEVVQGKLALPPASAQGLPARAVQGDVPVAAKVLLAVPGLDPWTRVAVLVAGADLAGR